MYDTLFIRISIRSGGSIGISSISGGIDNSSDGGSSRSNSIIRYFSF